MLLYAGGYHLAYHIYQFGLKSEMKSYILSHKETGLGDRIFITTVDGKISDSHFHWEEEGEEFTYKGSLYDVVSLSANSQGLLITCIKDRAENYLEAQMISLRQKEHSSKKNASISQFKFQPFCQSECKKVILNNKIKGVTNSLFKQLTLPNRVTEIHLPPPRC